jgi:hypothetical protein
LDPWKDSSDLEDGLAVTGKLEFNESNGLAAGANLTRPTG